MTGGEAQVIEIHPTAVVEPGARLGEGVHVGPYVVIGSKVELGSRTVVEAFAVLHDFTTVGPDNRIAAGAILGGEPQDVKYGGEPTRLVIGSGNRIGPYVTMSRGTVAGHGVTVLGDEGTLEYGAHVGHDCRLGNRVRIGAGTAIAGHVEVDDGAEIGPMVGIHQFTKVGRLARIEGHSLAHKDVPPFTRVEGNPAHMAGVNREGMDAAGLPSERIEAIGYLYEVLYRSGLRLAEAIERVEREMAPLPEVQEVLSFLRRSERGIAR